MQETVVIVEVVAPLSVARLASYQYCVPVERPVTMPSAGKGKGWPPAAVRAVEELMRKAVPARAALFSGGVPGTGSYQTLKSPTGDTVWVLVGA